MENTTSDVPEATTRPVTLNIDFAIDGHGHVRATVKEANDAMILGIQAPTLDEFLALLRAKIAAAQAGGNLTDNTPLWEPPWGLRQREE